jgi:predicted MPP superfamily phosphohydrolase
MLSELFVLILFVLISTAVVTKSCRILLRAFNYRSPRTNLNLADRAILLLSLLGVVCVCYGFVEPLQLGTTHISIPSKKLLPDTRFRLALISDLHCDGIPRVEKRLVSNIRDEKPDLILFAGDAANNINGLQYFKATLTALSKIAPLYAVDGNHDSRSNVTPAVRYGGTGAHVLNCSSSDLEIRGNHIWLGGVAIDHEVGMLQTLKSAPPDEFSIFLYHFPDGINAAASNKIDLFCAGHTHGGQVCLPWYGAIMTMSSLGKQFEWGYYKVRETSMYVSRGIGMTALPVRFFAPPELTIIDVVAGK